MPSTPSSFFSFTSASKVFTAARPAGKLTQSPHLSWHCGTMKMLLDCAQRSTLLTCEFCDVWPLLPFHSLWNILCILMLSRSRFESLAAKRKARKRSANYYKTSKPLPAQPQATCFCVEVFNSQIKFIHDCTQTCTGDKLIFGAVEPVYQKHLNSRKNAPEEEEEEDEEVGSTKNGVYNYIYTYINTFVY